MAEYGDTLYLLTPNELLASIDDGKTWNSLGARPQGRAVALIITDTAMYLVLQTEVFRSEDVGNQWQPIGIGLRTDNIPARVKFNFRIFDALAVDNMLFVGTNQGLFRFTANWKKLSMPTQHGVKSLAVSEDTLYVGTIVGPQQGPDWRPLASVLFSTDLGDSWTDITPSDHQHPVRMLGAVEVVPVGGTLMVTGSAGALLSYDRGKTWVDPGRDSYTFGKIGAFPVVALDENNFYRTNYHPSEIIRSTDGGRSWHPFMTGLVNSHVPSLVAVGNVLYALTSTEMLKSADGGESWESVTLNANGNAPL